MSHISQGPLSAYNSLSDRHLDGYFSNSRMRKHLRKSGLITRYGEIVSENTYRLNMSRKEHKKHVKDMLAQAIVHKTLDLERNRQAEIKKKLEEIAKIELVRRVRASRDRKREADVLPFISPRAGSRPSSGANDGKPRGKRRPMSAPARKGRRPMSALSSNYDDDDEEEVVYLDDEGRPITPAHVDESEMRYSSRDPIDTRHLYALDTAALRKYAMLMAKMEQGRGGVASPYMSGQVPLPPKSPHSGRSPRSAHRYRPADAGKSQSPKRPATAGQAYLHPAGSPKRFPGQQESLCEVYMRYHGSSLSLAREQFDKRQEVTVEQQHCGGNTLTVFRDKLDKDTKFSFVSYRHRGYPFSLTIYVDGKMDCRVSTCCEARHAKGGRIGGRHGHFSILRITGAVPCYKCQVEKGVRIGNPAPRPKMKRPPAAQEEVVVIETKPDPPQRELEDHRHAEPQEEILVPVEDGDEEKKSSADKYDDDFEASDSSSDDSDKEEGGLEMFNPKDARGVDKSTGKVDIHDQSSDSSDSEEEDRKEKETYKTKKQRASPRQQHSSESDGSASEEETPRGSAHKPAPVPASPQRSIAAEKPQRDSSPQYEVVKTVSADKPAPVVRPESKEEVKAAVETTQDEAEKVEKTAEVKRERRESASSIASSSSSSSVSSAASVKSRDREGDGEEEDEEKRRPPRSESRMGGGGAQLMAVAVTEADENDLSASGGTREVTVTGHAVEEDRVVAAPVVTSVETAVKEEVEEENFKGRDEERVPVVSVTAAPAVEERYQEEVRTVTTTDRGAMSSSSSSSLSSSSPSEGSAAISDKGPNKANDPTLDEREEERRREEERKEEERREAERKEAERKEEERREAERKEGEERREAEKKEEERREEERREEERKEKERREEEEAQRRAEDEKREEEEKVAAAAVLSDGQQKTETKQKNAEAESSDSDSDSGSSSDDSSSDSDGERKKAARKEESTIETRADVHHPVYGREDSDPEATHGGADPDNVANDDGGITVAKSLAEVTPSKPRDGSILPLLEASQTTLEVKGVTLNKSQVYEAAKFLETASKIRFVNFVNCGIDDDDVQKLMEALRKSPSDPVMLNLSLNPLTSGSVDYILETVKTKPSLEAVVLQGSRLGDEGVKQLVEGLLYNHAQTKKLSSEEEEGSDSGKKELQELDLSDCKFGDVGAGAVAKLLNSDMDVDTLTLSYNHAISSQGWSLIGNALNGNRNLQTLTLDHNFIGNDGLQCLCSGLYDNRSLTALDLNDVGLSQAGGATLNELLKRNTTILEITLTGNRLTDEQIDNVQKYIALNKSVNPEVEDSIRN